MKGILFKPDMIRAIVDGRKTVTRRLAGLKEINQEPDKWMWNSWQESQMWCRHFDSFWFDYINLNHQPRRLEIKPRYQVGEVVYIKEAHRYIQNNGDPYDFGVQYKSDSQVKWWRDNGNIMEYPIDEKWRSPLFLKEIFARYFIKIVDVRGERVQDISEEDAKAEGITLIKGTHQPYNPETLEFTDIARPITYKYLFSGLWDNINKDYSFESNPYIFRYKFGLTSVGAMK